MRPLFFLLLLTASLAAKEEASIRALYHSLDPLSLSQHLAFYELYPDTKEGKKALGHAWELLSGNPQEAPALRLPALDIQKIVSLITRQPSDPPVKLDVPQLQLIEKISAHLGNRSLKGHAVWTKEEMLALPSSEIDLGRGILLNQFDTLDEIRQYEASLDLMSLQIAVRLPLHPTPEDKIRAINHFIFQEMQFRFPPHSLYAQDVDLYTFLPSVLDSRQGVCLGVSILYLCIAQRLNLSLEIITPPGHIYVRYVQDKRVINIETTARGINLPSDTYLGINTRLLQQRTLKEVIGMVFINQAALAWSKEDYTQTVALYEKAMPYLPEDPLLKLFLGLNYLFIDKIEEGKKLLEPLRRYTFDYAVSRENIPDDFLSKKIDAEGLKAIFLPVDETRSSILEKQAELEKILEKYPKFRSGLLQLAVTWLQLGRSSEALDALKRYHKLDPQDATVEYYLAIISYKRLDYNRAWDFLKRAESLARARQHEPKALTSLRLSLRSSCPEPN